MQQGRGEMAEASVGAPFPRWFLLGIGALLLTSLAATGLGRLTGVGASRVIETQVAASVDIWFDPQSDGSMLVRRTPDGTVLVVLPSDGGGFMRGVARSLLRQRQLSNTDKILPFSLAQREDRRLFIRDMALGSKMELDGFGPSNTLSIARILEAGLTEQPSSDRQTHSNATKLGTFVGGARPANGGAN
jgi:putative photosynthetic complex assembly protein